MGIDYTKRPATPATPAPAAQPAAGGAPVSLSKVTLTKSAPTVSLTKQGSSTGMLRVNLNWNARPAGSGGGGLFKRSAPTLDLDLGCLYEFTDGTKGVVQALGNVFGSFDQLPFIALSGDDRTGDVAAGETLRINGARWNELRRIAIFANIYDGVPNWQ